MRTYHRHYIWRPLKSDHTPIGYKNRASLTVVLFNPSCLTARGAVERFYMQSRADSGINNAPQISLSAAISLFPCIKDRT